MAELVVLTDESLIQLAIGLPALDRDFLASIGWNPVARTINPPSGHPALNWHPCPADGCGALAEGRESALCPSCCASAYTYKLSREEFKASDHVLRRRRESNRPCTIVDCQRPHQTNDFCAVHLDRFAGAGMTLDEFRASPLGAPLEGYGPCRVLSCDRMQSTLRVSYCRVHRAALSRARNGPEEFDEERWARLCPPAYSKEPQIVLRALSEYVQHQVLLSIQLCAAAGHKFPFLKLRTMLHQLISMDCQDLLAANVEDFKCDTNPRRALRRMQEALDRSGATTDTEFERDVWRLSVFGLRGGILDFSKLRQSWLRAAFKHWVVDYVAQSRSDKSGTVQQYRGFIERLSNHLYISRADHGDDPSRLSRNDIQRFVRRLRAAKLDDLSEKNRVDCLRAVSRFLRDTRSAGLTRVGQSVEGLGEDFVILASDIPRKPERTEPRDLPASVMATLTSHLGLFESMFDASVARMVTLQMDTGRRSDEIAGLRWDCLDFSMDGMPAMIYDNNKANRPGRRLPIHAETAKVIEAQKEAVRARYPKTNVADLVLFPGGYRNPNGTRVGDGSWYATRHKAWIVAIPAEKKVVGADGEVRLVKFVDESGQEFSADRVVPYAYRHTYAQRHADAGTPLDVLQDLLDHSSADTTQVYYQVRRERLRDAVDRVTEMQFDAGGQRVWSSLKDGLDDASYARMRIGEIAVPFGNCTEPSNVKTGGSSCPFMFKCTGCSHFRSDPSYLPDLRSYLDQLLESHERVLQSEELADWAKESAKPSAGEIESVRRLIRLLEEATLELGDDDREAVERAVRVVRQARRSMTLGMPSVRTADESAREVWTR